MNMKLINELKEADHVLICGQVFLHLDTLLFCVTFRYSFYLLQALSHCVNHSVRHLVSQWEPEHMHKLVILKDGSSSVAGFEKDGELFLKDMAEKGVTICTTAEVTQLMGKM